MWRLSRILVPDEKMTILQKTNFAQLKTIIIQDGTNSMLKETNKSPEKIANNIKALISQIYEKFQPQKIFICEIPPVVENLDDENPLYGVNDKIDQVNVLLNDMFTCSDVYSLIPLNQKVKSNGKWSKLYHNAVHFDETGTPYLKSLLFSYVAPFTNHIPRPRKRANQANTGAIYADSHKQKVLKPRPNYEPNYHYNYNNTYGANKNGNNYFNNGGYYGNTKQTYTYVRGANRP